MRIPACASVLSCQSLCFSISGKHSSQIEQNFNILASLCSWADRLESYLIRNSKDRFSHDTYNSASASQNQHLGLIMRFCDLLHMQDSKSKISLCFHTVSPEPHNSQTHEMDIHDDSDKYGDIQPYYLPV